MTEPRHLAQHGFTLIEAIIAMVITGIVAGIVAVFMAAPVSGYLDSVRRAELSDVADLTLRRMAFELQGAVPNSVNPLSSSVLEFVPAKDGGRYRAGGVGSALNFAAGGDQTFDVLGGAVSGQAGDFLVIGNTGQPGNNVYDGDNRRRLSAAAGNTVSFAGSGSALPAAARTDKQLFLLVPRQGPVRFSCAAGELRRTTNYFAGFSGGEGVMDSLLATGVDCVFNYQPVNQANGLLTMRLTVTRGGETVTLVQQVHLDNSP